MRSFGQGFYGLSCHDSFLPWRKFILSSDLITDIEGLRLSGVVNQHVMELTHH